MLLCSSLVYQVSFLFLNFSRTVSKMSCKMWPCGNNLEPRCRTLFLVRLHRFTSPSFSVTVKTWQEKKERTAQIPSGVHLWTLCFMVLFTSKWISEMSFTEVYSLSLSFCRCFVYKSHSRKRRRNFDNMRFKSLHWWSESSALRGLPREHHR